MICATLVLSSTIAAEAKPQRPNIIIIYADDLDADEIGFSSGKYDKWPSYSAVASWQGKRGYPGYKDTTMHTPNIDKIANQGAVLERFYITSSASTPSRYSLLTGRYASRSADIQINHPEGSTAMVGFNTGIRAEESNIAKELKRAGYTTCMLGKWHSFPQSFKYNRGAVLPHNPTTEDYVGKEKVIKETNQKAVKFLEENYGWDRVDRLNIANSVFNLEWLVEGALNFMDESAGEPFFMYVALPMPHGQYNYAYCDVEKLDPLVTSAGVIDWLPDVMPSRASIYQRLDSLGVDRTNAMATYKDDAVGAILDKLEELGVADNTIVMFVGDNPSRGKYSVYEGAREPAYIMWPSKIKAGTVVEDICANIDVLPTMVDAAGGKIVKGEMLDGDSFLPMLLSGKRAKEWRKALLLEAGYSKAIVSGDWKYIANRPTKAFEAVIRADVEQAGGVSAKGKYFWNGTDNHGYRANKDFPHYYDFDQLYNLGEDLLEQKNVVDDPANKDIVAELQGYLKAFVDSLPNGFGEFKEPLDD